MITLPQALITPSEVIDLAFLSRDQLSTDSVRPLLITIAEERYIRPRFGNDLYKEFFKDEYADFVDTFIKAPLAHFIKSAMIDDLAVMVNDDGIKMFASIDKNNNSGETNQLTTSTTTGSSLQALNANKSVTESSSQEEIINTDTQNEKTTIPITDYPNSEGTSSATTIDEQIVTNLTETASSTTNQQQETTNNSTLGKNENSSVEKTSTNSQEMLRAADFLERRVLISQTFNDANTLLARAVRYVEENPDNFPTYNPKKAIFRRFF